MQFPCKEEAAKSGSKGLTAIATSYSIMTCVNKSAHCGADGFISWHWRFPFCYFVRSSTPSLS